MITWTDEYFIFVDVHTIDQLKTICAEHSRGDTTYSNDLEAMFFTPSATQALYNIEVSVHVCNLFPDWHLYILQILMNRNMQM